MKKRSKAKGRRVMMRRQRHAAGSLLASETVRSLDKEQRDRLSQAKAQWFFGEWTALAAMDMEALRDDPARDRFALLAASAHHQLGGHEQARNYAVQALQWGCPPRLLAQVLIAGVHNTLGRAAALARDEKRTAKHFRDSVALIGGPRETDLFSHARSVREMAKLGLLPEAASLVDRELAETRKLSRRPEQTSARLKILETEMELLQQELSLAQQRRQLYHEKVPADAGRLDDLRRKSVSQLGQDLWVLQQTGYKRGGYFVEFGATDGVLLSNTWLLEKEFGWQGICAEPNAKFFEQLKRNRGCAVSDACIAGVTGKEVEFIFADAFGTMVDYADHDMHAAKRAAYSAAGAKATLTTVSLHDFLVQHDAPRNIDYLSIDTEGSELEILAAFPFSEWNIGLLTVEHNFAPQREAIRSLLTGLGYRCVEREWEDWYVRGGSD